MSRKQVSDTFPLVIVGSMIVGFLWFVLTGAVWQFLPIGGAVGVAVLLKKSMSGGAAK